MRDRAGLWGHLGPTTAWASSLISRGEWGKRLRSRTGRGSNEYAFFGRKTGTGLDGHPVGAWIKEGLWCWGQKDRAEGAGPVGHWSRVGFGLGGVGVPFPNSCAGRLDGGGLSPLGY